MTFSKLPPIKNVDREVAAIIFPNDGRYDSEEALKVILDRQKDLFEQGMYIDEVGSSLYYDLCIHGANDSETLFSLNSCRMLPRPLRRVPWKGWDADVQ